MALAEALREASQPEEAAAVLKALLRNPGTSYIKLQSRAAGMAAAA